MPFSRLFLLLQYARSGRAACKMGLCKGTISKGDLRLGTDDGSECRRWCRRPSKRQDESSKRGDGQFTRLRSLHTVLLMILYLDRLFGSLLDPLEMYQTFEVGKDKQWYWLQSIKLGESCNSASISFEKCPMIYQRKIQSGLLLENA